MIAGRADDLAEGVERARQSIDSGAALAVLRAFQTFTREAAEK
jgi:anthranilate phosphoribosyltransferase